MRSSLLILAVPVLLVAAGCGDDEGSQPLGGGECRTAEGGEVTIVADDLAWDVDCLEAPADEPLNVIVDNQDDGVNHNIHFTDAPDKPGTELEAGPVVQELEVTFPAGDYKFVCDIHPNMVGTLTLTEANPSP